MSYPGQLPASDDPRCAYQANGELRCGPRSVGPGPPMWTARESFVDAPTDDAPPPQKQERETAPSGDDWAAVVRWARGAWNATSAWVERAVRNA